MTALAAMRSGAGLVTAAAPAPALAVVAAIAPELMTWPLEASEAGTIAEGNLGSDRLAALMAGKTVLAIGPGLGQSAETARFVTGLLSSTEIPAVIDADALNILATRPGLLAEISHGGKRTLVLTPHPSARA
jgi:NAD(P)H-hydrate epimerase